MARQDRLWVVVLSGYVLASGLLLFVYDNYVRSHVIGPAGTSTTASTATSTTRNSASVQSQHSYQQEGQPRRAEVRPQDQTRESQNRDLGKDEEQLQQPNHHNPFEPFPNSHRLHTCALPGNKTFRTLQAPDLIIAGAQKGGTSAFYFILKRHPHFSASMKVRTSFRARHYHECGFQEGSWWVIFFLSLWCDLCSFCFFFQ